MSGKIGRFEIISEIARSEFAAVYKAVDSESGRTVALKTLELVLPGLDRQQLLDRLLREAESTRNLSHQNIVLLYGAGEIGDQFCAAMEYIEGMSVAGMLTKNDGFSIWDMLDISRQVCNGLDYAHGEGLLHHRLQPGNVIVQWDGTVKILGFGVSSMWSEAEETAISPAAYYMSPEQCQKQEGDARSNWYSWGAILYEMATGQKPFDGATLEELQQKILEGNPVPPSKLNAKVQPALSALILKAMAHSPEERFESGRALLDELEACKETPRAAAAKTAASPAKSVAPPAIQRSAPKPVAPAVKAQPDLINAYGAEITAPPRRAAAAAAGANRPAPTATQRQPEAAGVTTSTVQASVAAVEETETAPVETETPRFAVDPMMAGGGAGSQAKSFSEISELPPIKAAYVPPPPPPLEAQEPEVTTEPAPPLRTSRQPAKPEKTKITLPAMPKIDPKLVIYGVGGAIAVVLLVVALVSLYVHFHTTDDEGAVPVQAAQATPEQPTAEVPPAVAAVPATETPSSETTGAGAGARARANKKTKPVPVAAPAAIPGQLAVNSTPEGAQIQVDGHFDSSWVTPFTLAGLTPGQHTVTVSKAGFNPETRTFDVTSGSKSFLVLHLNQQAATLDVSSDPPGATIVIDGREIGRMTPAQIPLEKGTHNVLVRRGGYLEDSTTANFEAGQTFHFAPRLKPLGSVDDIKTVGKFKKLFGGGDNAAGMGKLSIRTTPKGAQIAINQRILDRPSPAEFFLNPGTYVIDITASGYKPVHRVINVEQGGKMALDEALQAQ
jgi:tRNA A-37 threonylcarbamoyl transferase component Bud32